MVRILMCVCLSLCVFGSAPVRSQETKPNLTGRWILNLKLSNLDWPPKHEGGRGGRTKPRLVKECCETRSAVEIIEDKGPDIAITRTVVEIDEEGKERTRETVVRMTTDGNETVNRFDGETERMTAHWNSDRLIINEVHENSRFPQNIVFRSLSKDGRVMTVELYVGEVKGRPVATEVFDRGDK